MSALKKFANYWRLVGRQVTHMQLDNYVLFAVSVVLQLYILFTGPINSITLLTFVGTTLGVACVIAINAARNINGWLGIASGICFIIIGFHAKNYLSIGEQLSYMATLDIPVLMSSAWNKDLASKMRRFNAKDWAKAIGFTALVAVIGFVLMANFTNDPRPAYDALAFAISLTGGIVCFLRFNNQYIWWFASGIAQLILWFITFRQGGANAGMLINSCIYLTNDILAVTVSPWYNRKVRQHVIEQDAALDAKEAARN